MRVSGSGFMVWGLGFRVKGLGFMVERLPLAESPLLDEVAPQRRPTINWRGIRV